MPHFVNKYSDTNVKYMKQWYLFYNQQLEKSQRPVGLFENKDEYSQFVKSQRPIGTPILHADVSVRALEHADIKIE